MRVLIVLTLLAGPACAVCLGIAARSPTYVYETGRLIEPFAWMASARILFLLFGIGVMFYGVTLFGIGALIVGSRHE